MKKAQRSEIHNLPGMDDKFDVPANADLILNPEKPSENMNQIMEFF